MGDLVAGIVASIETQNDERAEAQPKGEQGDNPGCVDPPGGHLAALVKERVDYSLVSLRMRSGEHDRVNGQQKTEHDAASYVEPNMVSNASVKSADAQQIQALIAPIVEKSPPHIGYSSAREWVEQGMLAVLAPCADDRGIGRIESVLTAVGAM